MAIFRAFGRNWIRAWLESLRFSAATRAEHQFSMIARRFHLVAHFRAAGHGFRLGRFFGCERAPQPAPMNQWLRQRQSFGLPAHFPNRENIHKSFTLSSSGERH